MHPASILAVDCGASHVAAARMVRPRGGAATLAAFASEPVRAADRNEESWLEATAAALQVLGRRTGIRGRCVLGLPGYLLQLHGVTLPRSAAAARRRLLRFEAAQALPAGGDTAWSAAPVGMEAERELVVITAVRSSALATLCRAASRAGFHPDSAFPSWYVALAASEATGKVTAAGVSVNIGARSTQVVVRTGARCLVRNLGLGGDLIGCRLCDELGLARSEAAGLRGGVWVEQGAGPADMATAMAAQLAVDAFAGRLAGEISRLLSSVGNADGGSPPSRLQVFGGGSLATGLSESLAERLELNLVPSAAGWAVAPAGEGDAPTPLERCHAADTAAIATCPQRRDACAVNLLPRSLRREIRLARWRPAFWAASALAVTGCLWPIVRWRGEARRFNREAAELSAQGQALRARLATEQEARRRLNAMRTRLAALQRLDTARTGWATLLADLEARLGRTGDVWLERLELQRPVDSSAAGPGAGQRGSAKARSGAALSDSPPRAGLHLRVAGCVFDPDHPLSPAGDGCRKRVKSLWTNLAASPYVTSTTGEMLENGGAGTLRFEVTLVLAPTVGF